jgi:hypothetical protein
LVDLLKLEQDHFLEETKPINRYHLLVDKSQKSIMLQLNKHLIHPHLYLAHLSLQTASLEVEMIKQKHQLLYLHPQP